MITVGQTLSNRDTHIDESKRSNFGGIKYIPSSINVLQKYDKSSLSQEDLDGVEIKDVSSSSNESSDKEKKPLYLIVQKEKRRIREQSLNQYPEIRLNNFPNFLIQDQNATRWINSKEILSEQEEMKEIVSLSATQLVKLISQGKYTSLQVTQAFIKSAILAQDVTNCLTEICFDDAIERAKELDEYFIKTGGKTVGPLHGIPISVKDHIDSKGLDSSSGLSTWCFKKVSKKDSIIVQCLRNSGGIIYCKTSNPQTLLAIETDNNIFGKTLNPFNQFHSAGGSSGGEGALIAMNGSVLGIGTDIAGSIRLPALWNGLYGLKPSIGRLPHTGLQGPHEGMDTLMGVCGPLASNSEDLSLFCSVILNQEPWNLESQTLAIPWKPLPSPSPEKRLTIAIMFDDGLCSIHPPIKVALQQTIDKLQNQGHRIIEWKPIKTRECDELLMEILLQDQGEEYWKLLKESEEPAIPMIEWLLKERKPKKKLNKPEDLWKIVRKRELIRQEYIERWNSITSDDDNDSSSLDVILCPGAPTLAPKHNQSRHWGYTSLWNIVDWPAVVFPVKMPNKNDIENVQWPPHQPRNSIESHVMNQWTKESTLLNLPIGLQLVGRRLQEEKLLHDLSIIERSLS